MSEYIDEQVVRKQVETRLQKRSELFIHAAIFVCVNLVFWLVFGYAIWLVWLTLSWTLALAGHVLYYQTQFGTLSRLQKEAVEREVQREMASRVVNEKPKNDQPMRLTDDGELEEVTYSPELELQLEKSKHASG